MVGKPFSSISALVRSMFCKQDAMSVDAPPLTLEVAADDSPRTLEVAVDDSPCALEIAVDDSPCALEVAVDTPPSALEVAVGAIPGDALAAGSGVNCTSGGSI